MSTETVIAEPTEDAKDAAEPVEHPSPEPEPTESPAPAKVAPPKSLATRLAKLPDVLVAFVASLAFGLSFGLNYGVDNQTAYMLGALRLLDPTVLAKDWYATGPGNYHPAFAFVGWLLLLLDRGGFWVGVGLVVVATAGAMCFYWLASVLYERRVALASFLFLMAIAMVTRTRGVAVSYAFDFILQPSTLGSVFLVAALAPFVAGRYLLSGIFLGLSGLFHANYLFLGIGTFGLAHLCLGWKDLPKRLLHQIGPSFVVLLLLSKLILRSLGSPDGAAAQDILFNVRSPHHYAPRSFKGAFFSIAAWQMLGLGAGAWLLRGGAGRGKRLGALLLSFAVLLWTGTALSTLLSIQRVTQLFVWRFAPYHSLLLGFLFCASAVHVATKPALLRRIPPSGLALTLAGLVSVGLADQAGESVVVVLLFVVLPACIALALSGLPRLAKRMGWEIAKYQSWLGRHGGWFVVAVALVVCFRVSKPQVEALRAHSNVLSEEVGPEKEMYTWIRDHTPKDALFLIPPRLERFRLIGERAIVVDWKGSPYAPSDVLEWYRRLEDISGRPGFRRSDDLNDGYASLDAARLGSLGSKYHLDYAVVARGRERDLPGKVAFQNARFVVLDLH